MPRILDGDGPCRHVHVLTPAEPLHLTDHAARIAQQHGADLLVIGRAYVAQPPAPDPSSATVQTEAELMAIRTRDDATLSWTAWTVHITDRVNPGGGRRKAWVRNEKSSDGGFKVAYSSTNPKLTGQFFGVSLLVKRGGTFYGCFGFADASAGACMLRICETLKTNP